MKSKRVIVGLSGGVDSSVAAYLLKKSGYEVIGVFMKNWHDETVTISNECPWIDDSNDALIVANKLKIPFQTFDFSKEYKKKIIDYMFSEYENGRTPNPDVLCNREIKFDIFLETAVALGADFIATGHYCIKKEYNHGNNKKIFKLFSGVDNEKDQSYFLCQLNQKQLSKSLIPIGDYTKKDVRKIASEQGLITAEKKDSQGLCFVGKVSLPDFLQQKLKIKKGKIILINSGHKMYGIERGKSPEALSQEFNYVPSDGIKIGEHNGAHFFTIGQRKGLGVGGYSKPLFVISLNVDDNIIYVGEGKNHPGLRRMGLKMKTDKINWINSDFQKPNLKVLARFRYRQKLFKATLIKKTKNSYLIFEKPQTAISAGQFAVWYIGNELIGSGLIE